MSRLPLVPVLALAAPLLASLSCGSALESTPVAARAPRCVPVVVRGLPRAEVVSLADGHGDGTFREALQHSAFYVQPRYPPEIVVHAATPDGATSPRQLAIAALSGLESSASLVAWERATAGATLGVLAVAGDAVDTRSVRFVAVSADGTAAPPQRLDDATRASGVALAALATGSFAALWEHDDGARRELRFALFAGSRELARGRVGLATGEALAGLVPVRAEFLVATLRPGANRTQALVARRLSADGVVSAPTVLDTACADPREERHVRVAGATDGASVALVYASAGAPDRATGCSVGRARLRFVRWTPGDAQPAAASFPMADAFDVASSYAVVSPQRLVFYDDAFYAAVLTDRYDGVLSDARWVVQAIDLAGRNLGATAVPRAAFSLITLMMRWPTLGADADGATMEVLEPIDGARYLRRVQRLTHRCVRALSI